MSYPGDPSLDQKIQQRILSAFGEAVRLYQEGNPEECRTVLRSILEVDPSFGPGSRLMQAVDDGAVVDLGQLLGDLDAAGGVDTERVLIEARQAFADREYTRAGDLARSVLSELPGHEEARRLCDESDRRSQAAGDVERYVSQARVAMRDGSTREVEAFLELARDLDPSHPEITAIEAELSGGSPGTGERAIEFEFEPAEPASAPAPPAPAPAPPAPAPPPTAPSAPMSPGPEPPESVTPPPEPPAPTAETPPPSTAPEAPSSATSEDLDDSTVSRRAVVPLPSPPPVSEPEAVVDRTPLEPGADVNVPIPAAQTPPASIPPAAAGAAEPEAVATAAPTERGEDAEFEFGRTEENEPAEVATADEEGDFTFDRGEGAGEVAFQSDAGVSFGAGTPEDAAERVQVLLAQGQEAYDAGDYQGAIDTWSRVYLIQSDSPETDQRIEEARRGREENERQADHTFFDAREAFEQGRSDDARALCQQVLELVPQHLEAHDLLNRLDTPAAPPPPPPATPDDEADLFRDDFVPAPVQAASAGSAGGAVAGAGAVRAISRRLGRPKATKPRFSLPLLALFGAVALLVLVVGILLRSTLFGGAAKVAETTLAQAEEAARAGRLQDAINLLRSLQAAEQLEGDVANQVGQRIVEYQRRLKTRASPTPSVQLEPIRQAVAAGQRVKALRLVREGLSKVPGDPELTELENEVLRYSATVASLADAVSARDNDRVIRAAQTLLTQYPDDAEAQRMWTAATFNEAIVMLRKYQVGTAKAMLDELVRRGENGEVSRVRDFAERYVSRPVDPRYQIFVTNVELRPFE